MLISQFANKFYGVGNWFVDCFQRTIPDHFHWHIRRIDFDAHIPVFRTFGPSLSHADFVKKRGNLKNALIFNGLTNI